MASGYNKSIIMGNLTADPRSAATKSGMSISNMTVAINPPNQNHETVFLDVVAFDKTADNCNQYLAKGRQVLVDGRIDVQKWEDKEGNKRVKYCVVANSVQFLGSKDAGGQDERPCGQLPDGNEGDVNDDDLPF